MHLKPAPKAALELPDTDFTAKRGGKLRLEHVGKMGPGVAKLSGQPEDEDHAEDHRGRQDDKGGIPHSAPHAFPPHVTA